MRPVALAAVLLTATGTATPALAAHGPLDQAKQAARRASFTGEVVIRWADEDGVHVRRVTVEAGGGVLVVRGPTSLMANDRERLVHHRGEGWGLLWPAGLDRLSPPEVDDKYDLTQRVGPSVAGRPTVAVDVRWGDLLRERVYVDPTTSLLLGREELDTHGRVTRSIRFVKLSMGRTGRPVAPTGRADRSPEVAGHLPPPYRAPDALAGGYRRVGAYRRGPTVQLVFSDGVYGLSVFEQPGRLRGSLRQLGRPVRGGPAGGRRLTWSGGEVLVWEAGGTVFTAVGEGPLEDVLAATRSMPARGSLSTLDRARRACHNLLDSFV